MSLDGLNNLQCITNVSQLQSTGYIRNRMRNCFPNFDIYNKSTLNFIAKKKTSDSKTYILGILAHFSFYICCCYKIYVILKVMWSLKPANRENRLTSRDEFYLIFQRWIQSFFGGVILTKTSWGKLTVALYKCIYFV